MYGIIYYALNTVNNKFYVGQTIGYLEIRRIRHYFKARTNKDNNHFRNALKKYSKDIWEWNTIDIAYYKEQLNALEKNWIRMLDSLNNGYNSKDGGSNGRPNEETKRKMSEAMKGLIRTEETRKRISEARKGVKLSKEHCKRLSLARMGYVLSEGTKRKIGDANSKILKGRKLSKNHCENISKGHRGIIFTEERREKIGLAHKGLKNKPCTEEHCRNMSEAAKNHVVSEETKRKISKALKGNKNATKM